MPMWRCPHCGTPQAETARCWVCRRSSTTCSTCRQFRRSVAAQLGYCGLDRRRQALSGEELRGCWEASAERSAGPIPAGTWLDVAEPSSSALRLRGFVPVELVRGARAGERPGRPAPAGRSVVTIPGEPPTDLSGGWADPIGAEADPVAAGVDTIAARADPGTLFADADL